MLVKGKLEDKVQVKIEFNPLKSYSGIADTMLVQEVPPLLRNSAELTLIN